MRQNVLFLDTENVVSKKDKGRIVYEIAVIIGNLGGIEWEECFSFPIPSPFYEYEYVPVSTPIRFDLNGSMLLVPHSDSVSTPIRFDLNSPCEYSIHAVPGQIFSFTKLCHSHEQCPA